MGGFLPEGDGGGAPLLEDRETKALIARAQAGHDEAREQLVAANLGLVRHVLKRFSGRGFEDEDLYQLGCMGLVKAINNFNLSMPVRFSTYAVPMILGEIQRYLRDSGPVKVSRRFKQLAFKADRLREELTREQGREPTFAELAAGLGADPEELVDALEAVQRPTSIYKEVGDGEGDSLVLLDRLEAEGGREDWFEKLALRDALSRLEPRLQTIVKLRFFRDLTQAQVGEKLGISQVQVSRLERQALDEVRRLMEER